jgi:hypothetical protein
MNERSAKQGAIESGDRGKVLVLRLVQISRYLKPFNFPDKSWHGVFQQNRSGPEVESPTGPSRSIAVVRHIRMHDLKPPFTVSGRLLARSFLFLTLIGLFNICMDNQG